MVERLIDPIVWETYTLGDFAKAESLLGEVWQGPGIKPKRNGADDLTYAGHLLICGNLTLEYGLRGGSRVLHAAKDLLSLSARLFAQHGHIAEMEARTGLCLAYQRCGEFQEAIALCDSVLAEQPDLEVTVTLVKSKAISQTGLGDLEAGLATLNTISSLVPGTTLATQGKYYLQRGLIQRKSRHLDEAADDYQLAADICQRAKSLRYEAAASNNLAGVCTDRGQYTLAHVLTERAISLFRKLGDINHEGMAWDQKAQAYLRENKLFDAEKAARKAVALLEQGEHSDFLAEALGTHGRALIEIAESTRGHFTDGLKQIEKVVRIHESNGNSRLALEAHKLLLNSFLRVKANSDAISESSRETEKVVIDHLLSEHQGRIAKPAIALGLSHSSLHQRLKSHFPDLLEKRRPPQKRRKSLFRQS